MSSNSSTKLVLSNEQQKALNNARKRREALRKFQLETQHASIKKLMNEGGRRSRRRSRRRAYGGENNIPPPPPTATLSNTKNRVAPHEQQQAVALPNPPPASLLSFITGRGGKRHRTRRSRLRRTHRK